MDFYRRVELVCRQIPYGKAATYGQIALLCGMPKHARQVGYALRTGKAGEVCAHRVVNARGILSGAASFDTPDQQKLLLEAEGVPVEWTPDGPAEHGAGRSCGRVPGESEGVWLEKYHGGGRSPPGPV